MPDFAGTGEAASVFIAEAIRKIGAGKGAGEEPSNEEYSDGLSAFKTLLDGLSVKRNAVYVREEDALTLVSGTRTYTIGASGTFNTPRPVKCEQAFIRVSSIDYPVDCFVNQQQNNDITDKTATGRPTALFYNQAHPLGVINFDLVPDQNYSFYLYSWKPYVTVSAITTQLALPPGYRKLIVNSLAVALAPEYGKEAPGSVYEAMRESMRDLAIVNSEPSYMKNCVVIGTGSRGSNNSGFTPIG